MEDSTTSSCLVYRGHHTLDFARARIRRFTPGRRLRCRCNCEQRLGNLPSSAPRRSSGRPSILRWRSSRSSPSSPPMPQPPRRCSAWCGNLECVRSRQHTSTLARCYPKPPCQMLGCSSAQNVCAAITFQLILQHPYAVYRRWHVPRAAAKQKAVKLPAPIGQNARSRLRPTTDAQTTAEA